MLQELKALRALKALLPWRRPSGPPETHSASCAPEHVPRALTAVMGVWCVAGLPLGGVGSLK
eukprot:15277857-Alexandrium_andersonii.AAC.1